MTIILLEQGAFDQTLAQGLPTMKGRALIAYGNKAFAGEHGVVTNHGGGIVGVGQNQTIGYHDGVSGQFTAIGILGLGVFDKSLAIGNTPAYFAYFDDNASAIFFPTNLITYNCGSVTIDVGPPNSATPYNGLMVISSGSMLTANGATSFGGTGAHSVTGLGFRPQLLLVSWFGNTIFGDPGAPTTGMTGMISIGAADEHGHQWAFGCNGIPYISGGGSRTSKFSSSRVVVSRSYGDIQHVSMDADGFTLNYLGVNPNIVQYWAIADPAGAFMCGFGHDNDASISPGFRPDAVLTANCSSSGAENTNVANLGIGVGGVDNQLHQYSGWAASGGTDGGASRAHYWNTSAISMTANKASPLAAAVVEAHATAFTSTGVNFSWTGAAGSNLFGWAAMKTGLGPGAVDNCGGFTPGLIRWTKR